MRGRSYGGGEMERQLERHLRGKRGLSSGTPPEHFLNLKLALKLAGTTRTAQPKTEPITKLIPAIFVPSTTCPQWRLVVKGGGEVTVKLLPQFYLILCSIPPQFSTRTPGFMTSELPQTSAPSLQLPLLRLLCSRCVCGLVLDSALILHPSALATQLAD
ncbi:hypothetical protein NDU88_003332 [Pleurodeles waltl]|uniref:Uncharacterized protein n=1 Tax=Pleurodeles waltl TaxID=8319 RepID=A0AAV7W514_PLEWA|nr:hypothetical protein NDU88_003332 [Pleurodeles waltl]